MGRPKKQEKRVCDAHMFSIRPKQNHTCYYQQAITAKICSSGYCQGSSSAKNCRSCYQGPIFNKDKNFSTPSFILNSDRFSYIQNANKGKLENDKKFINYSDQKSQIFEPKPNSKNMYCSVCKERYEDYREHIRSEKHKKKIRSHTFSAYIRQIEMKYKQNRKKNNIRGREKDVVQTNDAADGVILIVSQDEQNQYQEYAQPRKRVKVQKKSTSTRNEAMSRVIPSPYPPLLGNQYFQSPFFYPNFNSSIPFNYQPCHHPYMNQILPYPFGFNHFMPHIPHIPHLPQGCFNGMMGNYHEGVQPQIFPNFPYHNTDATYPKQPQIPRFQPKQNYIIVDDDKE